MNLISKNIWASGVTCGKLLTSFALFTFSLNGSADTQSIFDMSLEELLSLKISVTSRTDTSILESASAAYVITQEDIQRSGIRSLPELLRLVPGIHISRQDGNKWQINSRRNSLRFSNSMQVLMDGRTLYNPLFGGTYWEVQDTLIEDIDRIEVIRGPGASSWGANAITGVVNIVTKSAEETIGTYLYVGGGSAEIKQEASLRYGFETEHSAHRIYAKHKQTTGGEFAAFNEKTNSNAFFPVGATANDGVESNQLGFKSELHLSEQSTISFQGDWYNANTADWRLSNGQASFNPIDMSGANIVARYQNTGSENNQFQIKYIYDQFMKEDNSFNDDRILHDLELLFNWNTAPHHMTFGLGYRYTDDQTSTPTGGRFSLNPNNKSNQQQSLFFQDQWATSSNLSITFGAKLENNDDIGLEYNPNIRGVYKLNKRENLWFSASRAVRTPTRIELDAYLDFNDFVTSPPFFSCPVEFGLVDDPEVGCIIPIGDKNFQSNVTNSIELGYRKSFNENLSLDISFFRDKDSKPSSNEKNEFRGTEVVVRQQPTENWRMEYQLSYIDVKADNDANSAIATTEKTMFHIRSYYNVSDSWQFNSLYFYSDGKNDFGKSERLNLNWQWTINPSSQLIFSINNLFNNKKEKTRDPLRINTVMATGFAISYRGTFK